MTSRRNLLTAGGVLALAAGLVPAGASLAESMPPSADATRSFGHPVYTRAEIDRWSTASPEYARLAGSWAGNVNRAYTSYGTRIDTAERDLLRDESGYVKVQAVLWAADGTAARRAKAALMLDQLRAATSWETDMAEQYRLVAGWACTNLAQAAAIIGYASADFERFLAEVCYPLLDWSNGPNWHASFADSKLAIAAYLGDATLWEDAKAYFYERIAQSIYHSAHDGATVRPLLGSGGAPSSGLTVLHWGGSSGAPQVASDYTPLDPSRFPDGVNAERTRDLAHVSMGLGAWMHGARTILAQGDELEAHAYDRLLAAYAHHGDRVLTYMDTGAIPAPTTAKGDGGGAYKTAWFGADALFGADSPDPVAALCGHAQVTGVSPVGANHLIAEAFADKT